MTTDTDTYQDNDDLGLFLTIIESVKMTFTPVRTICFEIIKPIDLSKSVLSYNKGTLIFKNVVHCNLDLTNEFYEYPEFHRSAILDNSKLLLDTNNKLKRLKEGNNTEFKHHYLHIDEGNKETQINIICEAYEITVETEGKLLTDFKGLDE